jgi:hypothetical protein
MLSHWPRKRSKSDFTDRSDLVKVDPFCREIRYRKDRDFAGMQWRLDPGCHPY